MPVMPPRQGWFPNNGAGILDLVASLEHLRAHRASIRRTRNKAHKRRSNLVEKPATRYPLRRSKGSTTGNPRDSEAGYIYYLQSPRS